MNAIVRATLTAGLTAALAGPAAAQSTVDWNWFDTAPASASSVMDHGKAAFQKACAVCHGRASSPGSISLKFKYDGAKPPLLEDRKDLTAPSVEYFIRHGIAMMPPFRKTELDDADAKAISTYLSRKRR